MCVRIRFRADGYNADVAGDGAGDGNGDGDGDGDCTKRT